MSEVSATSSTDLVKELTWRAWNKATFGEFRYRVTDRIITALGGVR